MARILSKSLLLVGPVDTDALWRAGTTLNYFLDGGLNRAAILFPGIAAAALATAFGAWAHIQSQKVHPVSARISLLMSRPEAVL